MYEDFAPRLATVLAEYSLPIRKGELVVILSSTIAEPMVEALAEAVLCRGGHPFPLYGSANWAEIFYRQASDEQLNYLNPIWMDIADRIDAMFTVRATTNSRKLSRIDPQRMAINNRAQYPLQQRFEERDNAGEYRWCITAWPTQAAAQDAEMGFLEYQTFAYKAAALDQDDPVAYWQQFRDRQIRLVDWLKDRKHAEVRGPGIELSFNLTDRTWISAHGERNFPDGEIFTSPVEDSVSGYVEFNYPSVYGGQEVDGVRLVFQEGIVIEASAQKGEAYLQAQLALDDGARRLGEFGIGTNYGIQQFTRSTLYDEKIGGTIHMALGGGFERAGGSNKSAIHWDMVHDMKEGGEIYVDGQIFYRNGEFVVG